MICLNNILDYIDWRGDLTFQERPFNEVDNLIFSELAYVNMNGIIQEDTRITLHDFYGQYLTSPNRANIPLNNPDPLLEKAAECSRFRDILITGFVETTDAEKQTQFAAVTFLLPDNTAYLSFRGTDDTVVGWREDCNFSFLSPTWGQTEAVRYVNHIAAQTDYPLRIGGHSKGGHFAVYGAAFCDKTVRDQRIMEVYSNDGPGFSSRIADAEEYLSILPKVRKILPESSLVGLLLSGSEARTIVKSSAKGIYQHHPFTWAVCCDHFEYADGLSAESTLLDETLEKWLAGMTDDDRRLFVSTIFDSIDAAGISTLDDLRKNKLISYNAILKASADLPQERRGEVLKILGNLAKTGGKILWNDVVQAMEAFRQGDNPLGISLPERSAE